MFSSRAVAFITGAARGQGRSHAIELARAGADIIGVDLCQDLPYLDYPLGTMEELVETQRAVEALGRRMFIAQADVRDREGLAEAFQRGVAELGACTIVLANAGICPLTIGDTRREQWQHVLDINLTGVYHTIEVAKQTLIDNGGGCIIITSSTSGLKGDCGDSPGGLSYAVSKHAVIGLMRSYANVLAPHMIRVNSIHPTGVNTPMIVNPATDDWLKRVDIDLENLLPVPMVEPIDVSNAVLYLAGESGRYLTGVELPVDAGYVVKN
jgi:SDR family mycofactocin-dependent oxidoreductase